MWDRMICWTGSVICWQGRRQGFQKGSLSLSQRCCQAVNQRHLTTVSVTDSDSKLSAHLTVLAFSTTVQPPWLFITLPSPKGDCEHHRMWSTFQHNTTLPYNTRPHPHVQLCFSKSSTTLRNTSIMLHSDIPMSKHFSGFPHCLEDFPSFPLNSWQQLKNQ